MMPLQLSGPMEGVVGFSGTQRTVLRLLEPFTEGPIGPSDAALVRETDDFHQALVRNFATAVTIGCLPSPQAGLQNVASLPASFGYLEHGDIVRLDLQARKVRSLYRRNSPHNYFLVTERCNHYCLMCSQPPRNVDDGWLIDEIASCIPLLDPSLRSIGFTGGEPFSDWQRFISLIGLFGKSLPNTRIHVLTNGRIFAQSKPAAAWAALANPNISVGIPLYASTDVLHDYIVQSAGAFDQTVHGILRLKDKRQKVEIRVVLHALTVPCLEETCRWLSRNLPFADHVALMGLENTGFTLANQQLWIDPDDYREVLAASVQRLVEAHIPTSVYNLPRCVLDPSVWPYAVQSISDWKNAFLPVCDSCAERPRCGGFFSTGRPRFSRAIHPFPSKVN